MSKKVQIVAVEFDSSTPAGARLQEYFEGLFSARITLASSMRRVADKNGESVQFTRRAAVFSSGMLSVPGFSAVPAWHEPLPDELSVRELSLRRNDGVVRLELRARRAQRPAPTGKQAMTMATDTYRKQQTFVTRKAPARVLTGGLPSLGKR